MKLALVQYQPTPDLEASVQRGLEALEEAAAAGAKLVAYPELAFTPFYPQHCATPGSIDLAETIPGPTTEKFQEAAENEGFTFKLLMEEDDHFLVELSA